MLVWRGAAAAAVLANINGPRARDEVTMAMIARLVVCARAHLFVEVVSEVARAVAVAVRGDAAQRRHAQLHRLHAVI